LSGTVAVEDVLQETFAEVFRRISSFEPQGEAAFYRWLVTIAKHRLADMVKAQQTAKRGGGRRAGQGQASPGANSVLNLLDLAAVHDHTPSRSAARHEAVSAIQVALAGLNEDYRQALQLRYVKAMPVKEIAETMGRTERAVHMLCNRGLKSLRAAMGRSSQFLTKKT
jgi:RNA polymerase sigma factor (sigma-70 family)